MRTSSQLNNTNLCDKNPGIEVSEITAGMIRAQAQRQVVKRILQGEPIDDIRGELDSILSDRHYKWENNEQKNYNLALYAARIKKMTDWEVQHINNITFPDFDDEEEKYYIDFFGEQVKTLPDYFYEDPNGNDVYVCKVKTDKFPADERKDIKQNEAYVLGLVGEKLYPGKTIHVRYLHLGSKKEDPETFALNYDVQRGDGQMIAEMLFDEDAKRAFATVHEETKDHTCSGKDCGGCAMYNVCNYEEPPIAIDEERTVQNVNLNEIESRLTDEQRRVVDFEQGIARANAGAGAGKTLSVALRTAELLTKGYEPEDICLLTFTRAGAEEMATRVSLYCAAKGILVDPERLVATTFNSFCQNIIKDNFEVLGYTDVPRVIPRHVKMKILNEILDNFQKIPQWNYSQFSDSEFTSYTSALTRINEIFETIKKERYTIDDNPFATEGETATGPFNREMNILYSEESTAMIFQMYDEFQRILKEKNLIEYDDQIREVEKLVREINPDYIANELAFKHIIVDEFQDTDLPQIELLQDLIQHEGFKSFMVVGDDSQSIFSFRHTTPEYMINFENYFGVLAPGCDFSLVENHRSNKATIDYANQVNALNADRIDKDLIATKPMGLTPTVNGFYSAKQEYSWIAKEIKKDIENGKNPSDIAVLGATWKELTAIAAALTEEGIPSVLGREIKSENSRIAALCSFYDAFKNGSAKGLMDYQNARMHGAMKGMTVENINVLIDDMREELSDVRRTLGTFKEYAKVLDEDGKDACYQAFLEEMEYARTMDELDEFFNDFKLYGKGDWFTRKEVDGATYAGVQVTTVHAAKGLEWDTTYLTLSKFDKEVFHRGTLTGKQQIDYNETNRKWFVGATRAKEKLVMTGQYVMSSSYTSKSGNRRPAITNQFVEKAFELAGKVYEYNEMDYNNVRILEKQELASKAQSAFDAINTSRSRNGKNNDGMHAVTKMRGLNRRKGKLKLPADPPQLKVNDHTWTKKEGNIRVRITEDNDIVTSDIRLRNGARLGNGGGRRRNRSNQMTPEAAAEYDRMTTNATQVSIDDWMTSAMGNNTPPEHTEPDTHTDNGDNGVEIG